MVGLSDVLEGQKSASVGFSNNSSFHVINKATLNTMMIIGSNTKPSPSLQHFPSLSFLHRCFLCRKELLPGKDIYMYKGDRAFCSVECRCRQIFMDEEESGRKDNCFMAVTKPTSATASSTSSASSSSRNRKGAKNRGGGGFAC